LGNKRVNVKGILADADLRRKLMVSPIQATQAREGIDTTPEQADRAYYVVSEGERATFFELEQFKGGKRGEPDRRHEMFVQALRTDVAEVRHDVARRDFTAIDGHPLAYARVEILAPIFRESPALDPALATAAQGVATAADERFVRSFWEIPASERGQGQAWLPFAKGGDYSCFYADIYLVVEWRSNGSAIRGFEGAYIRNEQHYFKPGLTWPLRTQRGFNLRVMPEGCIFWHKVPAVLPRNPSDTFFILGIANSAPAEFLLRGLMSFGSWEVGVIKRLPIPVASRAQSAEVSHNAQAIYTAKREWDEGNELSTFFQRPWVLRDRDSATLSASLDSVVETEARRETEIVSLYNALNDVAYSLYGIPAITRAKIEASLGEQPPEVLWPQMEGKTAEQKRMEHGWRLLSYVVKRVVEADDDGIVPFVHVAGESSLLERVRAELENLFPDLDSAQLETEIVNELKKSVKGYRRTNSLAEWLDNVYFDYHTSLYKSRPIFWHIASNQGTSPFAFGALVHYHKFDRNRIAKLRAQYLRETIDTYRREAALAEKEDRVDDRLEWQSRLEETQELDRRLQWVQEGHHEGPEGGDHDYRILTPWKTPDERPKGWDPDLDDGVKVNIEPLQKAGVLRIAKVV
jgi:hypothetical protein